MTEALILLLSALTAASPNSDDRAIEATVDASPFHSRRQRENETTEERIARIKARLGVRSVRISKVRCAPALCRSKCEISAAHTKKGDLAAAKPEPADNRSANSDKLPCNQATTEQAGKRMAKSEILNLSP